jgi:ABC-type multidrug transport system fused ATPase/permease subunit
VREEKSKPITDTLFSHLKSLYRIMETKRQVQIKKLVFFSALASFLELFTIGAIMPFIGALMAPEKIYNLHFFRIVLNYLGVYSPQDIILPFTVLFVVAVVISTAIRFLLQRYTVKLAFSIGIDLCSLAYRKMLYQPYLFHVKTNSSEIINTITLKLSEVIFYIVLPCVILMSSTLVLMAMLGAVLYFLPLSSFGILLGFGLFYSLISKSTKKRLSSNSVKISADSTLVLKKLQEGLGAVRDIILDGTQEHHLKSFHALMIRFRQTQAENQILSAVPRYVIESIAMLFVATLAYLFSLNDGGLAAELPKLVAIALAMQRLLPVVQQIYMSLSTIQGFQGSLKDSLLLLEKAPQISSAVSVEIAFNKSLTLNNVAFRYAPELNNVLDGFDLTINNGECIGIIGATGSGKSTLIDLIMGLNLPTDGCIRVDDAELSNENLRSWQNKIAHVPQNIYLADATVVENIAFGVPSDEIDIARVHQAAKLAQIHEMILALPDGYSTEVGERGAQLSGGQRQRIGIARAFYKKARLLVLDEATSALDNDTEEQIINAVKRVAELEGITTIMIAHRLTTLKSCNRIIELMNGKLIKTMKYDDIVFS